MAADKNISTYTAYDIEKYHKGLLSSAEMNKLERAALEDPFLADALDGYADTPVNLAADLANLANRLQQKKEGEKIVPINRKSGAAVTWWRMAAMLVLVSGIAYLGYRFAFNTHSDKLALQEAGSQNAPASSPATNKAAADSLVHDSNNATPAAGTTNLINSDTGQEENVVINRETVKAKATSATADVAIKQDSINVLHEVTVTGYNAQNKKSLAYNTQELETKNMAAVPVPSTPAKQESETERALRNRSQDMARKAAGGPNTQNRANIYRGQIVDAQQNPVPFANITNPIDNVGTYSDAKGRFSLISSDTVLQVQVRSVGFQDKNIALQTSAATNQVVLQDDQSISAVVMNQKRQNSNIPARQNNLVFDEPEPEAGWYNFDSYLVNNIRLPDADSYKAKTPAPVGSNGEVQLAFEVSKQGRPINIKVEKSLCEACDKEAIRLLKEGPKWKRNKGKKNTTTITVSF